MCTVTFIARRNGYALGMNRDEKLTRVSARPPAHYRTGERDSVFPSEPSGGTWIGVNDAGVCFALINWYSISARATGKPISRGEVVKAALAASSQPQAADLLAKLPLAKINPFRLIAIFPYAHEVMEWRWNQDQLEAREHPWQTNIWISSGFDEPGAQKARGKTFKAALHQSTAGSLDWLRRLHRSHEPESGPYAICMHRADAATVSYTEVTLDHKRARLVYNPAAPCSRAPYLTKTLALKP